MLKRGVLQLFFLQVFSRLLLLFTWSLSRVRALQIFRKLGTPDDDIWPGFSRLPKVRDFKFSKHVGNQLRKVCTSA